MEWLQIPTDSILNTDLTNKELITELKYLALYAHLEQSPSEVQLKRHFKPKEREFIEKNKQNYDTFVSKSIARVIKKRGRNKLNYSSRVKSKGNSASLSDDLQPVCQTEHITEHNITEHKPAKEVDDLFMAFYSNYPRKVARGTAEKAWRKLSRQDKKLAIEFVSGKKYQDLMQLEKKEGRVRFIPYPASWIGSKGWLDEPVEKITNEASDLMMSEARKRMEGACE